MFQFDPEIHPRHICKACDTQLHRLTKWKKKGNRPAAPDFPKWNPHGSDCTICRGHTKDNLSTDKRQAETDCSIEPPAKIISDNNEISSIDPSRAVDQKMVQKIICPICRGIPSFDSDPVISSCGHVHCRRCILSWINIKSTCPSCREDIDPENLVSIKVFLCNVLSGVELRCINAENGCRHVCKASNVHDLNTHEKICSYNKNPNDPYKRLYLKSPLITRDPKYVRQKRLKEITHTLKSMCKDKNELYEDVLFFLLKDCVDTERSAIITALWHSNYRSSLSPSESLALKVQMKLSDNSYMLLYRILKERLPVPTVVSLEKIKEEAKRFMPSAVTFEVIFSNLQLWQKQMLVRTGVHIPISLDWTPPSLITQL